MTTKAAALTLVIVKAMQQNSNNFNKQCCVKLLNPQQDKRGKIHPVETSSGC